MKYADKLKIPFVVIIGEAEIEEGKITLKKMSTGEQEMIILEKAIEKLEKEI
ncbi:MAG: His/Gly/Thr/Pro-type tRNA ligase C-terminal domain-containing protein [Patescibacteria group bacterium]